MSRRTPKFTLAQSNRDLAELDAALAVPAAVPVIPAISQSAQRRARTERVNQQLAEVNATFAARRAEQQAVRLAQENAARIAAQAARAERANQQLAEVNATFAARRAEQQAAREAASAAAAVLVPIAPVAVAEELDGAPLLPHDTARPTGNLRRSNRAGRFKGRYTEG
jgi:predicted component of type VI protein secretion system